MPMLAEKKRRIKWCLNPRGNDWAKDENKFGQRMLQKMGWEPGMGLGARGQGITDILRVRVKSDTKGFGSSEKYDESWTQQQQSFDDLLAELNGADKNSKSEECINISSLEDKSKKSRARVHYHKFTRGKDVSRYSSKDLNSIIGVGIKKQDDTELNIETSKSMYDYFKDKRKRSCGIFSNDYENQSWSQSGNEGEESEQYGELEKQVEYEDFTGTKLTENFDEERINEKQHKKKKKRKEKCLENNITNNVSDQAEINIRNKKNKRKTKDKDVGEVQLENSEVVYEVQNIENNSFEPLENDILENYTTDSVKKKRKKRHKDT